MDNDNIKKVEEALVEFICKASTGEHLSGYTWQAIPETAQALIQIWQIFD